MRTQDFCLCLRRKVGHIANYVTEVVMRKTGKKTSNTGGLFIVSCLRYTKITGKQSWFEFFIVSTQEV